MKPRWLALVVGLQVTWLLGTAVIAQHNLTSGRVIRVETEPVDPRDLLRGDYLILNYHFSRIPLEQFQPPLSPGEGLPLGTPVHVELAPVGDYFRMLRASTAPMEVMAGHVMLLGRTTGWNGNRAPAAGGVQVAYGLERFYVREGTGNPQGKLTVEISVPASGAGMLKAVYLDGVPYAEAMGTQGR